MFQAFVIQALVTGGVYALLAVGFSLIFGVARMVNLAHTSFLMLAAYGMFYTTYRLGLDVFTAILISLVATVIIGLVSYKLF
ncbi:MAG: branched-chain amino acid ABC transporter permease, partial [Dehalococcoidia bacterium]